MAMRKMEQTKQERGAVSDRAVREKTGASLEHWFEVLDRYGAAEKGHTLAARHLQEAHGISGWYAQGITVAYERARGLRQENQGSDGKFGVSVSRVLPAGVGRVVEALQMERERRRWLAGLDAELRRVLDEELPGLIVKDAANARLRFRRKPQTVELRLTARSEQKASLTVQLVGLAGPEDVEVQRGRWRAALDALRAYLAPTDTP